MHGDILLLIENDFVSYVVPIIYMCITYIRIVRINTFAALVLHKFSNYVYNSIRRLVRFILSSDKVLKQTEHFEAVYKKH